MPLPIWLIPGAIKIGAAIAGAIGVGSAVHGAAKMKEANDTMEVAQHRHEKNMERFEKDNKATSKSMDKLGKLELEILNSFTSFSDAFEQIKNRPVFAEYEKDGVILPKYDGEKIKEVSVGAGVLLGGLGGAALGTAGGFAAAGAATAAVMALGTASTGTAIASLSGAALTNATLAALGGGAIAAGGGGIAAGTAVLGAATLGVGLLVGGVIFSVTGKKISGKADEAWLQMKQAEEKINKICSYLNRLRATSNKYYSTLSSANTIYQEHLTRFTNMVMIEQKTDWNLLSDDEKVLTENTVLLVGLLYNMCKVKLVLKTSNAEGINRINSSAVNNAMNTTKTIMEDKFPEKFTNK